MPETVNNQQASEITKRDVVMYITFRSHITVKKCTLSLYIRTQLVLEQAPFLSIANAIKIFTNAKYYSVIVLPFYIYMLVTVTEMDLNFRLFADEAY